MSRTCATCGEHLESKQHVLMYNDADDADNVPIRQGLESRDSNMWTNVKNMWSQM